MADKVLEFDDHTCTIFGGHRDYAELNRVSRPLDSHGNDRVSSPPRVVELDLDPEAKTE